jgi:hypothetical protein
MPLSRSVRIAASEFILSLQASAICPLFWGLAYLGVTSAAAFLSLAMMFSITLYQALGAAYARYYHRQTIAAIEAICEARKRYKLIRADVSEFLGDIDFKGFDLNTGDLQIVVLERCRPEDLPFLNYRAYLQPMGTYKSIALVSRQSSGQRFFILHELGHLTKISHYAGLYDSYGGLRLAVTYVPFLCLSPTWLVAGLILVGCFADWFLLGAIRREYIADCFAWSALAQAGEDVKAYARRISVSFRCAQLKDDFNAAEFATREKICKLILETPVDGDDSSHGMPKSRWIKDGLFVQFVTGVYTVVCLLIQLLLTVVAIWQFDGEPSRIGIFLIAIAFFATSMRVRMNRVAQPAYERLKVMLLKLNGK